MDLDVNETHLELWQHVIRETGVAIDGIHGPQHWARVERNGLYIARETGADPEIVTLFALFHDSRRVNDGIDTGHGERGAAYAHTLRPTLDFLSADRFEQLVFACTWHTDLVHHDDPTIHTCFDADRLDLGRVGIAPSAQYLNTAAAKRLVDERRLADLDALPLRAMV